MRRIGDRAVIARYIGDKHVIARYVGEQQIFMDYSHRGLLHQFDGRNNTGTGVYDPNAEVWIDLVTGVQATLQSVSWQNFGVLFSSAASKVYYQGQSVQQYTIFNTHMVSAFQGMYPRIFGENPYPSLYLQSALDYRYGLYAQGKDTYFRPATIPAVGAVAHIAMRFGGTGEVDLFYNGTLAAIVPDVEIYPSPVATMYIGCRTANDRAFSGEIYEHLVYDRALSDAEIYRNYLISSARYP